MAVARSVRCADCGGAVTTLRSSALCDDCDEKRRTTRCGTAACIHLRLCCCLSLSLSLSFRLFLRCVFVFFVVFFAVKVWFSTS